MVSGSSDLTNGRMHPSFEGALMAFTDREKPLSLSSTKLAREKSDSQACMRWPSLPSFLFVYSNVP